MADIKNIVFDFGGVIIDIDFIRSIRAFIDLGIEHFEDLYGKSAQSDLFDDLDCGRIDADTFRNEILKMLPPGTTHQQVDEAWNAILIDLPAERIRLLEEVRKHYNTFLLSNTNIIHYPVYTGWLRATSGYKSLDALFDKVFLSFELGMRKPDPAFFEFVIRTCNLIPEETLFIDDSYQNLPPAELCGLKTLLIADGKDVLNYFKNGRLIEKY